MPVLPIVTKLLLFLINVDVISDSFLSQHHQIFSADRTAYLEQRRASTKFLITDYTVGKFLLVDTNIKVFILTGTVLVSQLNYGSSHLSGLSLCFFLKELFKVQNTVTWITLRAPRTSLSFMVSTAVLTAPYNSRFLLFVILYSLVLGLNA